MNHLIDQVARAMHASENKTSGWEYDECSPIEIEGWTELAAVAIETIEAARELTAAQGDWVRVPRMATEAMWEAWQNSTFHIEEADVLRDAYANMIAAAPAAPVAESGVEAPIAWRLVWATGFKTPWVDGLPDYQVDPADDVHIVLAYSRPTLSQPIEPQGAVVGAEMVERAEIAYRSAAVAEGFDDPSGDQITLHRRWMRHALEAALPVAAGAGEVDDAMVEAVESAVGMGHTAWDMVDPKEIIRAARDAAMTPATPAGKGEL